MRHFRSLFDLSADQCRHLVLLGLWLKEQRALGQEPRLLTGRILGLLFEKSSMRTRVSFEAAMAHQGGTCIFMTGAEVGLGKRESVADFARVISTYVDVLAVRTFSDSLVAELADHAGCPVINALSDGSHPCQALGDLVTIHEAFGKLEGLRLTFVGDGNNVARSLALASIYTGIEFVLSAPPGYEFSAEYLERCRGAGGTGHIRLEPDPWLAVAGADLVYTDVWASMGQEEQRAHRRGVFKPFQVTPQLLARAKPTVRFLHCLPAHRGEEVVAEVIDGPQSLVVTQAANRLHAQKGLLLWLLGRADSLPSNQS